MITDTERRAAEEHVRTWSRFLGFDGGATLSAAVAVAYASATPPASAYLVALHRAVLHAHSSDPEETRARVYESAYAFLAARWPASRRSNYSALVRDAVGHAALARLVIDEAVRGRT